MSLCKVHTTLYFSFKVKREAELSPCNFLRHAFNLSLQFAFFDAHAGEVLTSKEKFHDFEVVFELIHFYFISSLKQGLRTRLLDFICIGVYFHLVFIRVIVPSLLDFINVC